MSLAFLQNLELVGPLVLFRSSFFFTFRILQPHLIPQPPWTGQNLNFQQEGLKEQGDDRVDDY